MDNAAWLGLIRRIPAARYDSLMVTMRTGVEIMIQNLSRLEGEYMVIRGRLAGSTDDGRVMILPYEQICSLGFNKRMTEAEIHEIFGKGQPALESSAPLAVADDTPQEAASSIQDGSAPAAPVVDEPPPAPSDAETVRAEEPAGKPAVPSKSLLLARLRARLAEKSKGPS